MWETADRGGEVGSRSGKEAANKTGDTERACTGSPTWPPNPCLPSGAPSHTTRSAGQPSKCRMISLAVDSYGREGG